MDAFLYARIDSSDYQGLTGLESQLKRLKTCCASKNIQVRGIFQDIKNGMSIARDGLLSLLADLPQADIILVTKWDCLARHPDHLLVIQHEIQAQGKKLFALDEPSPEIIPIKHSYARKIELIRWWEDSRKLLVEAFAQNPVHDDGQSQATRHDTMPTYLKIIELHNKGVGYDKIAKMMNMDAKTIHDICLNSVSFEEAF